MGAVLEMLVLWELVVFYIDHHNKFLAAFAYFFGQNSNNKAKLLGLLYGLRIAKNMSFLILDIEMDSKLIIKWLIDRRYSV